MAARRVRPADALGGSLIPAWPIRAEDGSVSIEYVPDWGVLLAGWSEAAAPSDEASTDPDLDPTLDPTLDPAFNLDGLLASGDRLWVGIANDVLQKFVPDPPDGTYSMVRHHALMLGAATLWLGAERARLWQRAHTVAARAFLRRLNGGSLWAAVEAAEQGLAALLADPRAKSEPEIAGAGSTAIQGRRWPIGSSTARPASASRRCSRRPRLRPTRPPGCSIWCTTSIPGQSSIATASRRFLMGSPRRRSERATRAEPVAAPCRDSAAPESVTRLPSLGTLGTSHH